MPPAQAALFAAAVFGAAFLQAASGFGFALLAMPLATLALGLETAGPVVAAAGLLLYIANTLRLRRHVNWGEWARLGAAGLLGVPLGFQLSAAVPAGWVRAVLGLLLIAYAAYTLITAGRAAAEAARPLAPGWAYVVGLTAGTLAGAYNIPGPPLVVYGDQRGWARDEYRATLQALFLLSGLLVVGGHLALGHFDALAGRLLLLGVPALAAGNLAGQFSDRYLQGRRFRQLVLLLILATGLALLFT
ncbi:MAG: sulfite exporter TauE/SafE family protein [Anaerolineales bacterium]|nr:sulfite exporter TauE/SafE family protein [Anaerolineales bacterium]